MEILREMAFSLGCGMLVIMSIVLLDGSIKAGALRRRDFRWDIDMRRTRMEIVGRTAKACAWLGAVGGLLVLLAFFM